VIFVDAMMASGLRWVLTKVAQAALAELDDDTPLRAALLDASVRLELGEISQEDFAVLEDELLARISAIRARHDMATGPIAFAGLQQDAGEAIEVEAGVTGDFHEPAAAAAPSPHGQRARRKRRSGAHAA
jgi:hypothetical protein